MKSCFSRSTALVWLSTTALTGIFIAASSPVFADGGAGGGGAAGGTNSTTVAGGNGANGAGTGGGGGGGTGVGTGLNGAGTGGGAGGAGSGGAAGGTGGTETTAGGAGAAGAAAGQGGGGGGGGGATAFFNNALSAGFTGMFTSSAGGAGGAGNTTGGGGGGGAGGIQAIINNTQLVTVDFGSTRVAGAGGAGGNSPGGLGGSGGSGGAGLILNGVSNLILSAGSTFQGGAGGNGGSGVNAASAGNGGVGGDAVTASNITITNNGAIIGGNGGAGAIAGAGGYGITGSGLTIDNTGGTISGGFAGNGGTQNAAIRFTGGTNLASYTGTYGGGINVTGGSFQPALNGTTIGTTLTTTGPITFGAGTAYNIRVSPTASDSVTASGTATLTGATVNATYSPGAYVARQYTILTAAGGGIGGANVFAGLINNALPANFAASLSYAATSVFLNLALNFVPPPGSGLNQNQQAVANALVGYFNTNGGIPLVFGSLTPAGLTQISGETATGVQQTTVDAQTQFLGTMTDPFIAGRNDSLLQGGVSQYADEAMAYAGKRTPSDAFAAFTKAPPRVVDPFAQRWSIWAAGYGGSQTTDGNAVLGSSTTTSRIAAGAVGLDYRISPATIAGFAMAGGGTNFSVAGAGTGRSDLFQAGGFVRHTAGPAYLTAALAYGWQDVTTDRTVTIAGVDRLRASFNANALSGRIEGGYRLGSLIPNFGLTPYAAAQATTLYLPAYGEQAIAGANTFALNFTSRDVTASRSELGLRSDTSFAMQDSIFTLRGRAAWAHNFNPDRSIGATFQTLPGASFVVNGARQASDAALTTASAELRWRNNWSLATTFEGEFSNVTRAYTGKGAVRYVW